MYVQEETPGWAVFVGTAGKKALTATVARSAYG